ncbi:NAD(P)-binding protein [Wilcoxina mikolae CBS 423.85]|nr:NAD(P)-binding protein [Wilcoxina mikolae CBS 423.85]
METITKAIHDTVGVFMSQAPDTQTSKATSVGASGFVAAHVLTSLLDGGYKVKCTVRSQAKADDIRKLRPLQSDQLDFAVVEDVAVKGAFDEAVKGVSAVIHTASPFVLEDQEDNRKTLLDPAIDGTVGILESIVSHNPSCKRVVITSSFASIIDLSQGNRPGYTYSERDWNPVTYEEAVHAGGAAAYCASKTLAEKAAWDFVAGRGSSAPTAPVNFSLATVCPPMVYGPLEHSARLKSLNTSTQDIYRLINGSEKSVPDTAFYAWVDVRDVGLAHVLALEAPPKPTGTEDRYFTTAGNFTYAQICHVIKTHFPQLVNSGLTPNPASAAQPPPHYHVDNSKSLQELGLTYRTLDTCIVDLVNSLLKLQRNEESTNQAAPVSVTDVRTGEEHRSSALAGTGLTVCDCRGDMDVCSCAPNTCARRGCAKKNETNTTAKEVFKGPKAGTGAVLKEWKEVDKSCPCDESECQFGPGKEPEGCECRQTRGCAKRSQDGTERPSVVLNK